MKERSMDVVLFLLCLSLLFSAINCYARVYTGTIHIHIIAMVDAVVTMCIQCMEFT